MPAWRDCCMWGSVQWHASSPGHVPAAECDTHSAHPAAYERDRSITAHLIAAARSPAVFVAPGYYVDNGDVANVLPCPANTYADTARAYAVNGSAGRSCSNCSAYHHTNSATAATSAGACICERPPALTATAAQPAAAATVCLHSQLFSLCHSNAPDELSVACVTLPSNSCWATFQRRHIHRPAWHIRFCPTALRALRCPCCRPCSVLHRCRARPNRPAGWLGI
jgi:hypothetical protein